MTNPDDITFANNRMQAAYAAKSESEREKTRVTLELEEAKRRIVELEAAASHARTKLMEALGNGADEDAWYPGMDYVDAAVLHIRAAREAVLSPATSRELHDLLENPPSPPQALVDAVRARRNATPPPVSLPVVPETCGQCRLMELCEVCEPPCGAFRCRGTDAPLSRGAHDMPPPSFCPLRQTTTHQGRTEP